MQQMVCHSPAHDVTPGHPHYYRRSNYLQGYSRDEMPIHCHRVEMISHASYASTVIPYLHFVKIVLMEIALTFPIHVYQQLAHA